MSPSRPTARARTLAARPGTPDQGPRPARRLYRPPARAGRPLRRCEAQRRFRLPRSGDKPDHRSRDQRHPAPSRREPLHGNGAGKPEGRRRVPCRRHRQGGNGLPGRIRHRRHQPFQAAAGCRRTGPRSRFDRWNHPEPRTWFAKLADTARRVCAFDNDKAGDEAAHKLRRHKFERLKPSGKDWNDDLKAARDQSQAGGRETPPQAHEPETDNTPSPFDP